MTAPRTATNSVVDCTKPTGADTSPGSRSSVASSVWMHRFKRQPQVSRGRPDRRRRLRAVDRIIKTTGGSRIAEKCVLKVTVQVDAWHREAYFGDMLRDTPGVVRVHESFAWMPPVAGGTLLYCLVSEWVEGGDLTRYLLQNPCRGRNRKRAARSSV